MYTNDNLVESLVESLADTLLFLRQKAVEFVFAANDCYVECKTAFGRIRSEYAVVGLVCDVASVCWSGALRALYIFAKQTLCMRVEPAFQNSWNKLGHISNADIYSYPSYLDSLLLNTFSTHNNIVYIEDPFNDDDIHKLNDPAWASIWVPPESGMLFARKTESGERIVRQLYFETLEPDFGKTILELVPEKSEVRLLLVYLQFANKKTCDIKIPIEEYYVGNDLLSQEYIASYMEHQWLWTCVGADWREDYVVRIMDGDLNIFEIRKDEYMRLEKNGILVCGMVDHVDDANGDVSASSSSCGEGNDVRTISLDEDAEMLLLFSATASHDHDNANEEKLC